METAEYVRFKRCYETYQADPAFRVLLDNDPDMAVESLGYQMYLEGYPLRDAIRWIVYRKGNQAVLKTNAYITEFFSHVRELSACVNQLNEKNCFPSENMYEYLQKTKRTVVEEAPVLKNQDNLFYFPMAVELSDGCSVGCPFCGFDAGRFRERLPYTEDNADLLRAAIRTMQEYAGQFTGLCPAYYATEPLDNPDFDRFHDVFEEETQCIPQMTTSVPDLYPEKIKRYAAKLGKEKLIKFAAVRFSVRTLDQFNRIMTLYSPEELEYIELIINNPESVNAYSDSGRAAINYRKENKVQSYSINCVSGIKINMVRKTLEYIEPRLPSDKHPLGFAVLEKDSFSTKDELVFKMRKIIEKMI